MANPSRCRARPSCIEGFEAATARVFIHADAGVADLNEHAFRAVAAQRLAGAHGQPPSRRHGIHRVENEIGERVANFVFRAMMSGKGSAKSICRSTISPRCCG